MCKRCMAFYSVRQTLTFVDLLARPIRRARAAVPRHDLRAPLRGEYLSKVGVNHTYLTSILQHMNNDHVRASIFRAVIDARVPP